MSSKIAQHNEVQLQFMDDFCKQANIFTNNLEQKKHQADHSRKLHKVFEKSLENATKNFPVMPEVFGMNDFLKPIKFKQDNAEHNQPKDANTNNA